MDRNRKTAYCAHNIIIRLVHTILPHIVITHTMHTKHTVLNMHVLTSTLFFVNYKHTCMHGTQLFALNNLNKYVGITNVNFRPVSQTVFEH